MRGDIFDFINIVRFDFERVGKRFARRLTVKFFDSADGFVNVVARQNAELPDFAVFGKKLVRAFG